MRIAFVLDDIPKENPVYTSVLLAQQMHNKGHEVFITDVRNLAYYPDGHMGARVKRAPKKSYKSPHEYIEEIKSEKAIDERITAADLDVLFIRNDPSAAPSNEVWAQTPGAVFGQVATLDGVIVLNDPFTLSDSVNKMYFQQFPEDVRPRAVITRDPLEIKEFYKEQKNKAMIIKPLQGSGGKGVFLINEDSAANLNSMIEANMRDGYIIAQEYIPEAAKGDIRLFMMNGEMLTRDGKVAALHRFSETGDARSNIHAGGSTKKAKITTAIHEIVDRVRPKLVQDGVFFAGLDIAGEKLLETNIFSPGGLGKACELADGTDFGATVVEAIERKVAYRKVYGKSINNKFLNTL
jgi:glutathione synthase